MSVPPFSAPYPCLVADVGGTNARFAILTGPEAPLSPMLRLDTGSEADFARTTLRAIEAGGFPRPRSLLWRSPGRRPRKAGGTLEHRRRGWRLTVDGDALAASLELEQGLLFNDFEALSLALPFLAAQDVVRLDDGPTAAGPPAPMVVVGPGTGLGVGGLVPVEGRWLPVSGEGGHVMVGPGDSGRASLLAASRWPCAVCRRSPLRTRAVAPLSRLGCEPGRGAAGGFGARHRGKGAGGH